ncbi:MAG: hypothetical protein JNM25_17330 [Planctomycetes bacterium]|nr:hypothetical protein [Planctomycetota bacterium]
MLLRTALPLLVAASALTAQNDFNWDKLTSGRLNQTLQLQASGAPANAIMLIVLSFNAGPTPLFLVDGVDTRSMQVGVDLLDVIQVAGTSPTGTATFSLPIDSDPSWIGLVLHWQCAIYPMSGPTFLGQISNDIVTQMGPQDTGILAPTALASARAFSGVLFDRNNNGGAGDVLVTGGGAGTLTSATGLATTELYDFRHMQVTPGPTMGSSRALHLPVRLNDNRVLLIGGADAVGTVLSSCEIYDPVTNSFSPTGSMLTPRILHAACRLADGRVMVAGGTSTLTPDVVAAISNVQSSVEIWNPTTGTWSAGPALGGARLAPALTLLSNNKVMVSGGVQVGFFLGIPVSASSTTAVQLWTLGSPGGPGSWAGGASMSQGRAGHHYNQVTLDDGRVLMSGGTNVGSLATATSAAPINGAELYNPTTNSWQTVNMTSARTLHSATKLPDGRVAVCGGAQGTLTTPVSISAVEVFNPATNLWSLAPSLTTERASHGAALLPDGTLMLFGGQGNAATTNTIEALRF